MFQITESKGFSMTFPNGYSASVQFGTGNYCDNRYKRNATEKLDTINTECKNAEVACFDSVGNPFKLEGESDIWMGNRSPEEVVKILAVIAAL